MRYRGILFDLDMTLFDFNTGNRIAVNRLLDEVGYISPNRYDEYEAVNQACWTELERGTMTNAALKVVRFERFFAQYRIDADPARAATRFVELLGGQAIMLPGAEAVAREIAAARKVAFVTNGIADVQRNRLARSPLSDLGASLIISEVVGVAKPRPGIFNAALEAIGVARGEALMIGDGATSDVKGANAAGIDACWLNPAGAALPKGVHAEYIVSRIEDCVGIALR